MKTLAELYNYDMRYTRNMNIKKKVVYFFSLKLRVVSRKLCNFHEYHNRK